MLPRILVAFALAFYALVAFDFLTHPLAAGANSTVGAPYLFRWLSFAAGTFTVVIALFVMAKVPGNVVGPLLLIYGLGAVGWSGRIEWASPAQAQWIAAAFTVYFYALALPALIAMIFYFPNGHAYPLRLRGWLPWLLLTLSVVGVFASLASAQLSGIPNPLYAPVFEPVTSLFGAVYPLALLAALVTVVLRYRHGGVRERQQLKWVVWFGTVVTGLSLLVGLIPQMVIRSEFGASIAAFLRVVVFISWQSFAAIAFGIAILRHQLWDIDIIIRRTLVYTALTALLTLVYFASVVLLQRLFGALTGVAQSPLAIVVSTLAIAALFTPLRRRIQGIIDRRFYRKKYDAQQVLAQFALTARDETGLDALTGELVRVVQETMQPEWVSVWLSQQTVQLRVGDPAPKGTTRDEGV
jgi:hypothetical protein